MYNSYLFTYSCSLYILLYLYFIYFSISKNNYLFIKRTLKKNIYELKRSKFIISLLFTTVSIEMSLKYVLYLYKRCTYKPQNFLKNLIIFFTAMKPSLVNSLFK